MILSLFFFSIILQSQHEGPDGNNYTDHCEAADIPDDETSHVEAWWNDPDGDCKSNDWIVTFWNTDGSSSNYTDQDSRNKYPANDGWADFSGLNWQCCGDPTGSTGGYGGECEWSVTSGGVIIIDCAESPK